MAPRTCLLHWCLRCALTALLVAATGGVMVAAQSRTPLDEPKQGTEKALPYGNTSSLGREIEAKQRRLEGVAESRAPLRLTYQRLTLDEERGLSLLEGGVVVRKGTFELAAERVSYREETGDLTAEGDVTIRFGEDLMSAAHVVYNLKLKRGVMRDVRGRFSPDVYFRADRVERLADHPRTGQPRFLVEGATFSSCNPTCMEEDCGRAWSMTTRQALVHKNHYLQLRRPAFWVRRAPVLALPYWLMPIKPSRTTGFLLPDVGYSTHHGVRTRLGFFWALRDNVDLTLYHESRSLSGNGQDLEFRWALSRDSLGTLTASRQFRPAGVDLSVPVDRESYRGELRVQHRFPGDLRLTVNARYATDINFNRAFLDDYRDVSRDSFTSTGSIERAFGGRHFATLSAQYVEDLRDNPNRDKLIALPRLRYRTGRLKLFGRSGLYVSWELNADRQRKIAGEAFRNEPDEGDMILDVTVDRLSFAPKIAYRFQLPWLEVEPSLTLHTAWWSRAKVYDPRGDSFATYGDEQAPPETGGVPFKRLVRRGEGLYRELYTFDLLVEGPELHRIFDVSDPPAESESGPGTEEAQDGEEGDGASRGDGGTEAPWPDRQDGVTPWGDRPFEGVSQGPYRILKIKHVITPLVGFSLRPDVPQEALVQIGGGDLLRGTRSVRYGLRTSLFGKVWRGPDRQQVVQLADLRLTQTYDLELADALADKRALDPAYEPTRAERPMSDLLEDLDIRFGRRFRLQQQASWDPYARRLVRSSLGVSYEVPRFDLSLYWGRSRPNAAAARTSNTVDLRFGVRMTEGFRWDLYANYDIEEAFLGWASLNSYVAFECWGLGIQSYYRQFRSAAPDGGLQDDLTVRLSITLKNVGSVADTSLQ